MRHVHTHTYVRVRAHTQTLKEKRKKLTIFVLLHVYVYLFISVLLNLSYLLKKDLFLKMFTHVYVCLYMDVCTWMWCLWRPEEDNRDLEPGVTGGCEPLTWEWNPVLWESRKPSKPLNHLSSPIRVTFKTPLYKCSTFSNKSWVLILKYVQDFQYVEQIVSRIYFYLIETYVIKSNKTMFVTNFYKFLSWSIPSCTLISNLKIIYSKVYVSSSQQRLDLEIGHILLRPHH